MFPFLAESGGVFLVDPGPLSSSPRLLPAFLPPGAHAAGPDLRTDLALRSAPSVELPRGGSIVARHMHRVGFVNSERAGPPASVRSYILLRPAGVSTPHFHRTASPGHVAAWTHTLWPPPTAWSPGAGTGWGIRRAALNTSASRRLPERSCASCTPTRFRLSRRLALLSLMRGAGLAESGMELSSST